MFATQPIVTSWAKRLGVIAAWLLIAYLAVTGAVSCLAGISSRNVEWLLSGLWCLLGVPMTYDVLRKLKTGLWWYEGGGSMLVAASIAVLVGLGVVFT